MRDFNKLVSRFLSRYYRLLKIDRLLTEAAVLKKLFRSVRLELLPDGHIHVSGSLSNGSRDHSFLIVLPFSFPYSQPELSLDPPPRKHHLGGGKVCVNFEWTSRNNLSQLVIAAAELL